VLWLDAYNPSDRPKQALTQGGAARRDGRPLLAFGSSILCVKN